MNNKSLSSLMMCEKNFIDNQPQTLSQVNDQMHMAQSLFDVLAKHPEITHEIAVDFTPDESVKPKDILPTVV